MTAIVLFSGGLDSQIILNMMIEQNVNTEALTFNHSYYSKDKYSWIKFITDKLNIKLTKIDLTLQFHNNILFKPMFGYGSSGLNPCLDCHRNFILNAWKYGLNKYGKDKFFIVTGDVIGQRGMSQTLDKLNSLDNTLDYISDYVLRPLSAKLLKKTIPEKLGIIDRNKLEDIRGRSRRRHLELIKKYNITNYETPGGGCLLTDKSFAKKLKNFKKMLGFDIQDIKLIKNGRHFKIDNTLIIISRNKFENENFKNYENKKFMKINLNHSIKSPIIFINKTGNIEIGLEVFLSYIKTNDKSFNIKINDICYNIEKKDKKEFSKYLIQ